MIYYDSIPVLHSDTWTTNGTLEYNIDGLAVGGPYNFTLVVNDTFGNHVSDTVYVTVYQMHKSGSRSLFPNVLRVLPLAVLDGALVLLRRKRKHHFTD